MNKNESKYFGTAILFDEALIYLLEKKDIEYITIKEICNKAGVNRSTFYLHYESINDLIEETMEYMNKKFVECFTENTTEIITKIKTASLNELKLVEKRYLTPYFSDTKELAQICTILSKSLQTHSWFSPISLATKNNRIFASYG